MRPSADQIGIAYCRLMEEILIRDELLKHVVHGGLAHGPTMALQPDKLMIAKVEFAYLQLRMICELVALGCLVAHGDIAEARTSKLLKSYEPHVIIKSLEKLHPSFFPQPSKQAQATDSRKIRWLTPITAGFLTKEELLKLYSECGRFLHRGSLQKMLAAPDFIPDTGKPIEWADKIWTLLEHHQIQTADPMVSLIGLMKDKKDSRPQFSFWKKQLNGTSVCSGTVTAAGWQSGQLNR